MLHDLLFCSIPSSVFLIKLLKIPAILKTNVFATPGVNASTGKLSSHPPRTLLKGFAAANGSSAKPPDKQLASGWPRTVARAWSSGAGLGDETNDRPWFMRLHCRALHAVIHASCWRTESLTPSELVTRLLSHRPRRPPPRAVQCRCSGVRVSAVYQPEQLEAHACSSESGIIALAI